MRAMPFEIKLLALHPAPGRAAIRNANVEVPVGGEFLAHHRGESHRIGEVFENMKAADHVEAAFRQRLGAQHRRPRRDLACFPDHAVGIVYSDHAEFRRCGAQEIANAATDLKQPARRQALQGVEPATRHVFLEQTARRDGIDVLIGEQVHE